MIEIETRTMHSLGEVPVEGGRVPLIIKLSIDMGFQQLLFNRLDCKVRF